jgi:K+-sensing histidine kinase KdpD
MQGRTTVQMKFFFANLDKILPWGLVILLALICGRLLYGTADQAVTLDHRNQQCSLLQEQRDILRYIVDSIAKGTTRKQLLQLFQQHNLDYFPKGNDQIVAGQVAFIFDNNRLARIETSDLATEQ